MKQKFSDFCKLLLNFFSWFFSGKRPSEESPSPHAPNWDSPCVGCEPNLDKPADTPVETISKNSDERPFNHLTTDESKFQLSEYDVVDSLRYSAPAGDFDIKKDAEEVLSNLDEADLSWPIDTHIYTTIVQKNKPKKKTKKASKSKPKPKSKKKTKKGKK